MLEYVDSDAMDWLTNQVDIDWPHKPTSQTNNPTSHNNINIQQHHVEVQVKVKVTDQEESCDCCDCIFIQNMPNVLIRLC